MKTFGWIVFAFFAIGVGLYPLLYFILDMQGGLLNSKSPEVLGSDVWQTAFYLHITLGAVSMLTGWIQFSRKIRNRNLNFHRLLGKVYLVAVFISGLAGLYLSFFATGGLTASFGFGGLAMSWVFTTSAAYKSITSRNIEAHEKWMIRSYALCFAAVTLRLWLPLFNIVLQFNFIDAYRVIAWMCWVPNLIVAEWIIRNKFKPRALQPA